MINAAAEMVILVDEHDQQLGLEEKMRAHTLGLLHRAFSVFIFRLQDDQVELLLQQRHATKYHCGALWSNTCCSHPRLGETVEQAGLRRLPEEMGITAKLHAIGAFKYRVAFANGLIEHEYDHILVGSYDGDLISYNCSEVQDYQWITLPALQQRLQTDPRLFTPWLSQALQIVQARWQFIHELLFTEAMI